jgi:hypothetical protein
MRKITVPTRRASFSPSLRLFTEGFDTSNLKDARSLLAELA